MEYSVIMPTIDRNERLKEWLKLLLDTLFQIVMGKYGVIITDNGKLNHARLQISEEFDWMKWIEGILIFTE